MDQLPRFGKGELICLLLFTCNYVVSVWRGFLFLWVLWMGYFIVALPEPSIQLFYRRHNELVLKFNVELKSLLHQEFYGDLLYKFKKD